MLPDRLVDKTTVVKNHTFNDYLGCVILRIILGLLIYYNLFNHYIIYVLCLFVIVFFTNKYLTTPQTWKVYPRTILTYSILGVTTYLNKNDNYNVGGIIVIADALMGMQSRYIQSNFLE